MEEMTYILTAVFSAVIIVKLVEYLTKKDKDDDDNNDHINWI